MDRGSIDGSSWVFCRRRRGARRPASARAQGANERIVGVMGCSRSNNGKNPPRLHAAMGMAALPGAESRMCATSTRTTSPPPWRRRLEAVRARRG